MNPLLRNKLKDLANQLSDFGIEAMDKLTADDFVDFEELLNSAISEESHNVSTTKASTMDELIQIRFFIRIWFKYGRNISKGLTLLTPYED